MIFIYSTMNLEGIRCKLYRSWGSERSRLVLSTAFLSNIFFKQILVWCKAWTIPLKAHWIWFHQIFHDFIIVLKYFFFNVKKSKKGTGVIFEITLAYIRTIQIHSKRQCQRRGRSHLFRVNPICPPCPLYKPCIVNVAIIITQTTPFFYGDYLLECGSVAHSIKRWHHESSRTALHRSMHIWLSWNICFTSMFTRDTLRTPAWR